MNIMVETKLLVEAIDEQTKAIKERNSLEDERNGILVGISETFTKMVHMIEEKK